MKREQNLETVFYHVTLWITANIGSRRLKHLVGRERKEPYPLLALFKYLHSPGCRAAKIL